MHHGRWKRTVYPFSACPFVWCAVFLTFLTLKASSTIRLGAFSLLMKGQDTSAATINLLQNAIIDRLQSINTTARPPLHSLVKNNTIIGNAEFLLDVGSTTIKNWLCNNHRESRCLAGEARSLFWNDPNNMVKQTMTFHKETLNEDISVRMILVESTHSLTFNNTGQTPSYSTG
jgi:hypothetical protein